MENHPIPQDITGFQFKLIGKMTVRQFVYLSIGLAIAWVVYILPIPFLLRFPFIVIFASIGAAFAFVPVDGRPLDVMVGNFIRALISPTAYVYEKEGANYSNQTTSASIVTNPLPQAPAVQTNAAISVPPTPLDDLLPAPQAIPETPEEKLEETNEEEKEIEEKITEVKQESSTPAQDEQEESLEAQLARIITQKEELEKELMSLKKKIGSSNIQDPEPLSAPTTDQPVVPLPKPSVEQAQPNPAPFSSQPSPEPIPVQVPQPIPMVKPSPIDMPFPPLAQNLPDGQEPNLITGTIKDSRGNPIQGVMVEVTDEEDNPVRAFKTNGLGEFASATSLSNGNYTVSFEDPREQHKFDTIQIQATGGFVAPLQVTSVDPREELRRELFN